ncbi:MAG: CHAT domain-containing protein [Blastocatellia bacterium]|nr:CHAT domain-containing protein [Blastocatellia bacterium]
MRPTLPGVLLISLFCLPGLPCHAGTSCSAQEPVPSLPNQTVPPLPAEPQTLKGAEKHSYKLNLKANDFVNLMVEPMGVNLVVRWLGPDGTTLVELDSPNGTQPAVPLPLIAEKPGSYTLEIESQEKTSQAGRYSLKLEAWRVATVQDRCLVEVDRLNTEAEQFLKQKKFEQAEPKAQQAVEKAERILGPDHQALAKSLATLGHVFYSQNQRPKAAPFYLRALAIYEKTLGPNHPTLPNVLDYLGQIYSFQGDYTKAEPFEQRSLTIREQKLGPEHPDTADSLNNLGALYTSKGDFARAEPLFLRALAIREKVLGQDHLMVGNSLNNLASLYVNQRNYSRAEPLFQRFLVLMEKLYGSDSHFTALACNNLATIYNAQQDYVKVGPYYQRALAIWEKVYGPNHPFTALGASNLAGVYVSLGDYAKAEPLYLRSLATNEQALGPDSPYVSQNYENLARLYLAKGDPVAAISFQSRCNEVQERDLQRNLISGSERQKLLYLNRTAKSPDRTLSLHLKLAQQNGDAQRAALTVVLRRKGRALDAMTTAIERLRRQQRPETQKRLDDYARLVSQISALTLRGPGNTKPEEHLATLRSLEEQKDRLEDEISRLSIEFKTQTRAITLEAVQKQIPADAVLAEYVVYRPFEPKSITYGNPSYAVYLLNSKGEINFADLGPAQPIEAAVDAFRKAIRNQTGGDPKVSGKAGKARQQGILQVKELGRKLEELIFQPVRKLLGKTNRVLLSPDGVLNLVPFDALVNEKQHYLVETFEFSYLTSGRDLLRLQTGIRSEGPPLVIANPDYTDGSGPKLLGTQFSPLSRLSGTEVEAKLLQDTFPDAAVYLAGQATKMALTTARRPEFLHIGTHGYFLPDVGQEAVPQNGPSRVLTRPEDSTSEEKTRKENGLLRSYLFFAGANQAGGPQAEGGVMTALEATGLNLWGTKLVVLSACDTGVGDVHNGEGVYGLRRALVLAGSESQMVSLWPVSDAGTRDLMITYYRLLKNGAGRSAALRHIRLEFLKNPKRQHPYFWASFILSGEWANLDGYRSR